MALRQPGSARSEEARLLWQMAGLAFAFGSEIIAGVLLGWGFDALFGTEPWGLLVGTLAGNLTPARQPAVVDRGWTG